jgi:hypothetical protein
MKKLFLPLALALTSNYLFAAGPKVSRNTNPNHICTVEYEMVKGSVSVFGADYNIYIYIDDTLYKSKKNVSDTIFYSELTRAQRIAKALEGAGRCTFVK